MIDLPFTTDPIQYEPDCSICLDDGCVEYGDRAVPCPVCAPEARAYVDDVGVVEP